MPVEGEGTLFEAIAEEYDRARPSYPAAHVELAAERGALGRGSRVLEIGCGTGKLTVELAARGYELDAVDPGAKMVGVAVRRLAGSAVRFHVARFEDVELPERAFDAVFAATAIHWVDPAVGWEKIARLLRPGGLLALFAHFGGAFMELEPEILAAWREVLPDAHGWRVRDPETLWSGAAERTGDISELWTWLSKHDLAHPAAARLFADVRIDRELREIEETAEGLLTLIRTQSSYLRLDPGRRRRLEARLTEIVEAAGGVYRGSTFATLATARRASPPP